MYRCEVSTEAPDFDTISEEFKVGSYQIFFFIFLNHYDCTILIYLMIKLIFSNLFKISNTDRHVYSADKFLRYRKYTFIRSLIFLRYFFQLVLQSAGICHLTKNPLVKTNLYERRVDFMIIVFIIDNSK